MEKTRTGEWVFPDYSYSCPICGATGCAVPHAFYSRRAIDMNGNCLNLRIARYRCHRKGDVPTGADKTFSLLPSCLAPYRYAEVGLMGWLLSFWILGRKSIAHVLDHASTLGGSGNPWLIDSQYLYRIKSLWECSVARFNQAFSFRVRFHKEPVSLPVFLEKGECYTPSLENFPTGFSGLGPDYYFHLGGWGDNAHFLFGTASQHRRAR